MRANIAVVGDGGSLVEAAIATLTALINSRARQAIRSFISCASSKNGSPALRLRVSEMRTTCVGVSSGMIILPFLGNGCWTVDSIGLRSPWSATLHALVGKLT